MQVTFFFRKPSPSYQSIEKLFSSVIEQLPQNSVKKHFAPYHSKGFIKRILIGFDARKNQGQINHITGDIHFVAMFLKKKKTILTIHDIGSMKSGNYLKRIIIRLFWFGLPMKFVEYITVISEFTKLELLNNFNLNPNKLIVINNCIPDIYQYSPKLNVAQKPKILQIGTKSNKNLERLIMAIENIDCKLIIIGKLNANQLNNLEQSKIDFENYFNIPEEKMLDLFIECDMLAYISTYEGFGMPVIEANAVGRPVLASNIEPINSVAGNAALLVNPYNIEEIKKGVLTLLNDNKLVNGLVKNGLWNASKYRSAEIAKEYMAVYQKILEIK